MNIEMIVRSVGEKIFLQVGEKQWVGNSAFGLALTLPISEMSADGLDGIITQLEVVQGCVNKGLQMSMLRLKEGDEEITISTVYSGNIYSIGSRVGDEVELVRFNSLDKVAKYLEQFFPCPEELDTAMATLYGEPVVVGEKREIVSHAVNECNEKLQIHVADEPGAGGACHRYEVSGFDTENNESRGDSRPWGSTTILFQNGPIKENGVNGLTHEVLLAIVADRLESFQKGPFSCQENAQALAHIKVALAVLHNRTKNRFARGVEGTNKV